MTASDQLQTKDRKPHMLMALVCLGLFMVALGNRATLVVLPTLAEFFQTGVSTVQWVILVYDLSVIGLVLSAGRLGDVFGRKGFYIAGFLIFSFSSVLCGLASSLAQLVTFRALQGVGGALIMAHGRALIMSSVAEAERGKALGLTSTAFHVGFLTGPTLGGFLIDAIGWRSVFFINLPVGLAAALLAWTQLAESQDSKKNKKLDVLGALYFFVAMASLVFAMNQLPARGFAAPLVLSCLALFVVALILFVHTEVHAEAPILTLSLFQNRLFTSSNLSLLFISLTQSAVGLLLIFYLQNIAGFSPSQMGWILVTNSAVIILFSPLAGRLSDRFGSRTLCTVGAALIVLGQFLIASLTVKSSLFDMVFPLFLSGLGWAMFNSPNQSAMLGAVPKGQAGAASGMNVTTARVGSAVGLAFGGSVFTYGLGAAGLPATALDAPLALGADPKIFLESFQTTIHLLNIFGLLAIVISAGRGPKNAAGVAAESGS